MQTSVKIRRMESICAGLNFCLNHDIPDTNNFTLKYMLLNAGNITGKQYERNHQEAITAVNDLKILICKDLFQLDKIIH